MSAQDDIAEIWAQQLDMYAGVEAKEPTRTDSHIHENCTIWESSNWDLLDGLEGLARLRAARPTHPAPPEVKTLTAHRQGADIHGDIAIILHLLTVTFTDGSPDEEIRNTGIWRRFPEGWRLIHNHEEIQR